MKLCLIAPRARVYALGIGVLLIAACASNPRPKEPVEFEGGTCIAACDHLGSLKGDDGASGCEDYRSTPKGAPCLAVCNNAFANGSRWNLRCLESVVTCAAATACPSVK